jgi:hypothetical protein
MEYDFFFVASGQHGSANSDPELIQVKKDTLLPGGPIERHYSDNLHSSPDPRVRCVLPLHIRLPCWSLVAAEYQRASTGVLALSLSYHYHLEPGAFSRQR